MKEILLTEKRDGIPCVIIFLWFYIISKLSIAVLQPLLQD